MNFKALDDPALLLPRVMDMRGAFERLGFVWHFHKGVEYAIAHVQLYHPIEAQFVRRAISHVGFVITLDGSYDSDCRSLGVQMRYGYPVNVRRGSKVIRDFKELATSDSTYWHCGDDRWLRKVEHLFKVLFENLKTKVIDRTFEGANGPRTAPGYEALRYAVARGLKASPRSSKDDGRFTFELPDQEPKLTVVSKYYRLPNFDKSTRPRHRRGYQSRTGY